MAINFSASFAACLAANLKVPRQFMYCIAQDAGTPYVLYKDGSERSGAMHWGETYIQQGSAGGGVEGSPPPHPHQDHGQPAIASPPMQVNGSAQTEEEVVTQQQMVQTQLHVQVQQQPVLECQEVVVQTQNAAEETHQESFEAHQQASMEVHQQVMHQAVERDHSPSEADRQWQTTADVGQYYARSHMLSPGSFVSYLKQPGVMLTPLNAADSNGDFAHMPDLVGVNGKPIKSEMRQFKCHTCGKDFKQKSTLLQHERIHTDSRPYGCVECGKRFRQQSHLTQHLRIHANEKPFACVYCERTFRQRAILNQHLRIHSGEKPFGCVECGKLFRQKAILNQHVRTHQDVSPHLVYKNGQLWPQDVPFPSEKEQGYENGDVQCFSPDGQFPAYFKDAKGTNHVLFGPGQGKMLPDVIQHGRSAGMPLYVRCPICQKEFKQKSTLLQHGCVHIESRPYPCGECGKRFRQQSHLTQHLRIHTNEKPYACVYCGRNFRQRTILNQHVRIHTGEKPYKCSQCGKDFRQKAILDQHTRTHQGDRPYCCPMPNCRRRFSTDQEVKRHVDNHMNPHASKRRVQVNERVASPAAVVKPELYFPQCYSTTQVFDHSQYGGSPPMQEFKASPTHALLASPTVVQ